MAKTISTPSLLTVSNCVPILGFTKPRVKNDIPRDNSNNFKAGLNLDRLGLSFSIKEDWAKRICAFRFHFTTNI
jgi:hypothetical protein